MAALSLQGVKKTYDSKQFVLHGIDVEVTDGEFVVMVGPSGCGKSTLLRMVAGLESVSEGTISIGETGFMVQNLSGGTITPSSGCYLFHWTADAEL